MPRLTRRRFIGNSLGGGLAVACLPEAIARSTPSPDTIPPHQSQSVPGIHGYADSHSLVAGKTLRFRLSTDRPHRIRICRLGHGVDDPGTDTVLVESEVLPAHPQPIHPGSYVHIPESLVRPTRELTLEAWVRPWSLNRLQGILSQEDKEDSNGFALGIGKDGYIGFYLGDGVSPDEDVVHRTPSGVLKRGQWHHLVATFDGATKRIFVDGILKGKWTFRNPFRTGTHPLRLGAMGERGAAVRFLDGDLAMVVLRSAALSPEEVQGRWLQRGLKPATGRSILGCWTFSEEMGEQVADSSVHGRHGRLINRGTWMIGGPSFVADVARFGGYDPRRDPNRGHGIRLASDDLYDCRWDPTFSWTAPGTTRPGIHVARVIPEGGGRPYDITFLVRAPRQRRVQDLLVLCSTNTWRAYNGAPFGILPETLHAVIGTDGPRNSPGDPPAYNLYRRHAAGQGTYQVGLRMPWPVAGPYVLYGGTTRYSHLMRAERFLHTWLERDGYRFDVAADDDLHRDPDLLRRYRVVVLNGHSEYWSLPMLSGLEAFLRSGGRLAVLSGNSLFWRVGFNADGTVMECRKVDAPGNQMEPWERGECWHSGDGLRGGLLRDCGHPGWRYVGLETLGWNNQDNPRNFGPYIAGTSDHPLFHHPEETGIRPGDRFGQGPDGSVPLANGHEFDLRLSTLARLQELPNPPGVSMPPDPEGMVALANGVIPWAEGGSAFDYFFRPIRPKTDQGGEMIYWERPEGGTVFNAGSIGSGWALSVDPRFQALMRNVLARFGVRPAEPRDGFSPPRTSG